MIEKITAYKISDGRIFENQQAAFAHQRQLTLKQDVEKMVEEYFFGGMHKDTIAQVLLELIEKGKLSISWNQK